MNLNLKRGVNIFLVLFILVSISGCGIYSFTGTSISPEIKTISIENFPNETGLGPSRLSQIFTERLKDYFLQNSNLRLVKTNGDLQFSGNIIGYVLSPLGAQQTTSAFQTGQASKLTINVKANFINTFDETQNFSRDFSFFGTIQTGSNLSAVENQTVDEIIDQIVLQIFNNSVANW